MLTSDDSRRLAFELAHHLGYPSPDVFNASLTDDEWAAWCSWWERKREGS